jgi:hypothetical protein
MHVKPVRLLLGAALLTAAGVLGAPAAVADGPSWENPRPAASTDGFIPPPTNLEVTGVFADSLGTAVYLRWDAGSSDPGVTYRVHNLTLGSGWTKDVQATTLRWGFGLTAGATYRFVVTRIGPDGKESAPSNEVTATPRQTPPTGVTATRDGDTVTVKWMRPDSVDPSQPGREFYFVNLNGVLETHIWAPKTEETLTVSFPRSQPGTTHEYTVVFGTQVSAPARLSVPPADDTTPPTRPSWRLTCSDFSIGWEISTESSDDTTPQPEIRYEFLESMRPFGFSVINYDLPRVGDNLQNFSSGVAQIRAVDEAGNRSAPADPVWAC